MKKERARDQKEVQYRMKKYELALVVSVNVDDEVRNATIEQVKELITRFGGTVTDPGTCEKKKLAYEISHVKGQRPETEGFYNFMKFEADVTCPAEVESRLRIMENVIRFLIVKDGE